MFADNAASSSKQIASKTTQTSPAAEVSSSVESDRRITFGIPNTLPHGTNFQTSESNNGDTRTQFNVEENSAVSHGANAGAMNVIGKQHPIHAFTNKLIATVVLSKDV